MRDTRNGIHQFSARHPGTARSVGAISAADRDAGSSAFNPAALFARLPGRGLLLRGHHVVWYWQAVAVVRSDPVRDQENHPA
jgi:hypothetical protein